MASNNIRKKNGARYNRVRSIIIARSDTCALCGKPLTNEKSPHPLSTEIDHIVPISRVEEVTDDILYNLDNLQAVHRCCNRKKSNKTAAELKRKPFKKDTCSRRGDF